ncbi:hypothetical protein K0M31_000246 [Melipona bicolor]|uniref:Uncharacterized protein n=1 Tax=Melipona bicolor TaxID=60889 RepID=A0AA40GDC7_9HYME|nr:hypothetical protein K0M31_000246 [Melipona bicolor]
MVIRGEGRKRNGEGVRFVLVLLVDRQVANVKGAKERRDGRIWTLKSIAGREFMRMRYYSEALAEKYLHICVGIQRVYWP